jgi:cell division protein FtsL
MESRRLTFILWFLVVVSAFGVIKSSYESRVLFIEWQELLEKSQTHEVEWGQLLIEKSTLASYANLESMAKEELKMVFPTRKQIVVVQDSKP